MVKEGLGQLLYPLLTKILKACDIQVVDESTRRDVLGPAFDSIRQAIEIDPEATVTFLENITKGTSRKAIAGEAVKILADKAGIKMPPDVNEEKWLWELGLAYLKEKALHH